MPVTPLSYREAGVDIDAGNELIRRIRPLAESTRRPGVMDSLGGFGGLFELPTGKYRNPVLVSGTDGVGTKLKLACELSMHETVGIDLVAMCVNDVIVTGAEPLFFLDYYACGKLDVGSAASIVKGIAEGCRLAGAALIGGETAEMPGMYTGNDYDLAGFCVGIVEKDAIVDGSKTKEGDVLIGLASSGPHSNGYSLIRKILETTDKPLAQPFGQSTLGTTLLAPTRIYVRALLELMRAVEIRALSHITGGGLLENLPRVLPDNLAARIDARSWKRPEIFQWLQNQGQIEDQEMYRTFNCGIGMVLCVAANDSAQAQAILRANGETVTEIGVVVARETAAQVEIVR